MADLERITHLSGLMIDNKDTSDVTLFNPNCTLNPPVVGDVDKPKMVNTDDPTAPIKKGTIIYNPDSNSVQAFQGNGAGAFVTLGAAGGNGTVTSINSADASFIVTNDTVNGAGAITTTGTIGLAQQAAVAPGSYEFAGKFNNGNAGTITMVVGANGIITKISFV